MPYPKTDERPVTEVLHGHSITDPYRWLEDAQSPETRAWTEEQMAHTQSMISTYSGRDAIRRRLKELRSTPDISLPHGDGDTLLYQRREAGQEHAVLYAERHGTRLVVVDPNEVGAGEPMHVDWAYTSQDGRYILYGLSEHGNEWAVLHVYDLQEGRLLEDRIPRARYASVAFPDGGDGFFYTRYPQPGSVPTGDEHYHSRVYYHKLGTPYQDDPLIFASPDDKRAMPRLSLSPSGRHLVIALSYGWTRTVLYVVDRDPEDLTPRCVFDHGEVVAEPLWTGDRLLVLTNFESDTGRVAEVSLADGTVTTVIPSRTREPIIEAAATPNHLFLHTLKDAVSCLTAFTLDGRLEQEMDLPAACGIIGLSSTNQALYYGYSSFAVPAAIHRVDDAGLVDILWAQSADATEAVQVTREWVTSKDGTRIPLFIAHPAEFQKNGHTPAMLTGYGGFDVPYLPAYSASVRAWVERGGIFAIAALRGGNEFGESWHRAGMREHKQNVFDDFASAALHLVQAGYTDPEHLGVTGRSNGGLLTGAFITQNPQLAHAVIIGVPLLDMLRFHRFLIADLWTQEYGSPENPEEFAWLYSYSPYHHVVPGTRYPATLIFTSDEDSRVDPMHARKMTALLQKASSSGEPILLRVAAKAGHGVGKSVEQWLDEEADIWTFLSHHLGLPVQS